MSEPIPMFTVDGVRPIVTRGLSDELVASVASSRTRLWASMFLVGLTAADDVGEVRRVLIEFALAVARQVDVRVLMDDFTVDRSARPNAPAADWLASRGILVRISGVGRSRSVHSKYLLVDQKTALIGSGNITPGALTSNAEFGLQVYSTDLTRALADSFEREWALAQPWRGATQLVEDLAERERSRTAAAQKAGHADDEVPDGVPAGDPS